MKGILLVRHAQASFGSDDYDRLSPLGHRQSDLLGRWLASMGYQPDKVISGGLRRHKETIAGIATHVSLPGTCIDPGFDEVSMGAIVRHAAITDPSLAEAAKRRATLGTALEAALRGWSDGAAPEGVETWQEYNARVARGLAASGAERVLIMTSGGAIASAAAQVLNCPPKAQIGLFLRLMNTSITHLVRSDNALLLHSYNATPHLDRPEYQEERTFV